MAEALDVLPSGDSDACVKEDDRMEGGEEATPVKLEQGDLVVHPSRAWPWFGVVSASYCTSSCARGPTVNGGGGAAVMMPQQHCIHCAKSAQDATIVREEATDEQEAKKRLTVVAEESRDDGMDDAGNAAADTSVLNIDFDDGTDELNGQSDEDRQRHKQSSSATEQEDVHLEMHRAAGYDDDAGYYDDYEYEDQPSIECDHSEPLTTEQKKLMVVWHPEQSKTVVDGTEVVVGSSKNSFLQEGLSTCRKSDPKRRGIIKRLKDHCDALILPECAYVVSGLKPNNRLDSMMDESSYGLYVMHDGWLGSVYQIWHRIVFETADGRRLSKSEVDGVVEMNLNEYVAGRLASLDSYTVFEGQRISAPHSVLSKGEWLDPPGYAPDEKLTAKISASEQFWNYGRSDSVDDPCWLDAADDEGADDCGGGAPRRKSGVPSASSSPFVDAAAFDLPPPPTTAVLAAVASSFATTPPADDATAPPLAANDAKRRYDVLKTKMVDTDRIELTVVKVERVKMSVEWRCPLNTDAELAEPKFDTLSQEQIEGAQLFKVPTSSICFRTVGSKFGYRIDATDTVLPVEHWRRRLLLAHRQNVSSSTATHHDQPSFSGNTAAPPPPQLNGECKCVYQMTSSIEASVMWENGEMEYGVSCDELMSPPLINELGGSKDYFPAMYIQLDLKGADPKLSPADGTKRSRFGLVLRANNVEKFATVRWYDAGATPGDEPTPREEEDVSFYDMKPHPDFNYVTGSLISRLVTDTGQHANNVGYVVQKLAGGLVECRWWGASENAVVAPWRVSKLKAELVYEEYSEDGTQGNAQPDAIYSPSEQEFDDLEELRYFDYSTLEEQERCKRIALIAELLSPVLALLQRLVCVVHSRLPSLERRQMLKLCLHCDDIANGYCHLMRFESRLKQLFADVRAAMDPADINDDNRKNKTRVGAKTLSNEEEAVWHMSTWMYDWLEVSAELNLCLQKISASAAAKLPPATNAVTSPTASAKETPTNFKETPTTAKETPTVATSVASTSSSSVDSPGETTAKVAPATDECPAIASVLTQIAEWIQLVQTAFTVITQVVGHGQTADSCVSIVADCIANLNGQLTATASFSDDGETPPPVVSAPDQSDLCAALHFVNAFQKHGKKIGRLPCFNYSMPTTAELKQAVDVGNRWRVSPMTDQRQNYRADSALTPCADLARNASDVVKRAVDGQPPTTRAKMAAPHPPPANNNTASSQWLLPPAEMVPTSLLMADAMAASVVVLLRAINDLVRDDLKDYAKALLSADAKPGGAGDAGSSVAAEDTGAVSKKTKRTSAVLESDALNEDDEMATGATGGTTVVARRHSTRTVSDSDSDFGLVLSPGCFEMLDKAPSSHRFVGKAFEAESVPKLFMSSARKELKMLQSSLPVGIRVKAFEDRLDLFSCMMQGPEGTPYAHGLFFFDVRLKDDYPVRPPHVFYRSMSKRLNPNLYEDGMVCLSLLGTWDGKETELWTSNSTLLQVFVSIQSLVLVPEPYFCEPGYEQERGTDGGRRKSRDYNETAILLTLEALQRCIHHPPPPFEADVRATFIETAPRLLRTLERYQFEPESVSSFPLSPTTQGFRLCVKRHADNIAALLAAATATTPPPP